MEVLRPTQIHLNKDAFQATHPSERTLCVLEVMTPKWSNFVLTTDIPHRETDVLVLHRLNIKT